MEDECLAGVHQCLCVCISLWASVWVCISVYTLSVRLGGLVSVCGRV